MNTPTKMKLRMLGVFPLPGQNRQRPFPRPRGKHMLRACLLQLGLRRLGRAGERKAWVLPSGICKVTANLQPRARAWHRRGAQTWLRTCSTTLPLSRSAVTFLDLCQPPRKLLRAGASYISVHPQHYEPFTLMNQYSEDLLPCPPMHTHPADERWGRRTVSGAGGVVSSHRGPWEVQRVSSGLNCEEWVVRCLDLELERSPAQLG